LGLKQNKFEYMFEKLEHLRQDETVILKCLEIIKPFLG